MAQVIKDKTGKKLGEIREASGRLFIFNASGKKLGSYDPKANATFDVTGRKLGSGNLLATLLV